VPEVIRTAVRNHGGGHANHQFFWEILGLKAGGSPNGAIADAIKRDFTLSLIRHRDADTDSEAHTLHPLDTAATRGIRPRSSQGGEPMERKQFERSDREGKGITEEECGGERESGRPVQLEDDDDDLAGLRCCRPDGYPGRRRWR
jgi:hypothetical protein